MSGIPKQHPALLRADRLAKKASTVGFDWPDRSGPRAKVAEEVAELDVAIESADQDAIHHELGDLLFAIGNLARHLGVEPETALQAANARFESRFRYVERHALEAGEVLPELSLERMEALWEEAKRVERDPG